MLHFRSYAKINLYLDVIQRRRDGYHDIETIFQTISLHDDLHASPADGLVLTCSHPGLPVDDTNLVLRAARRLQEKSGVTRGAALHLDKRIPVAAGLAGGSGNAAAALAALNRLWELDYGPARLAEIARDLGADVPYCLRGGTMAGTGRGDQLRALPALPTTWFVLVHPPIAVSTASVYNHPGLRYKPGAESGQPSPAFDTILHTLQQGHPAAIVFNRMEAPVFAEHPELATLKDRLLQHGCTAAAMSGSGPTLFGLCPDEARAHAIAAALAPEKTSVVHSVQEGLLEIR